MQTSKGSPDWKWWRDLITTIRAAAQLAALLAATVNFPFVATENCTPWWLAGSAAYFGGSGTRIPGMWNTDFGEVERSSERSGVERSVPPIRFAMVT